LRRRESAVKIKSLTVAIILVLACVAIVQLNPPSEEYARFEKLAKALIAVPKSVIDKRQAEYERKKAAKKRKVA
jgi:hypothetical protein